MSYGNIDFSKFIIEMKMMPELTIETTEILSKTWRAAEVMLLLAWECFGFFLLEFFIYFLDNNCGSLLRTLKPW